MSRNTQGNISICVVDTSEQLTLWPCTAGRPPRPRSIQWWCQSGHHWPVCTVHNWLLTHTAG